MLETAVRWMVEQVDSWGYLGIFVMMFIESTFFPFPSEVAMVPAGYLAFHGKMSAVGAVVAGLVGSLGGAFFNYYLSQWVGLPFLERYGRFFFVKRDKLVKATEMFRHHGEFATFVCRLIPVVRQLISVPAGLARMNVLRFGWYTGLGAGLWVVILTAFGWFVGKTLQSLEESPEEGIGAAWAAARRVWNENELVIYLSIGIPIILMIATYVYFQRRKRRKQTVEATSETAAAE